MESSELSALRRVSAQLYMLTRLSRGRELLGCARATAVLEGGADLHCRVRDAVALTITTIERTFVIQSAFTSSIISG